MSPVFSARWRDRLPGPDADGRLLNNPKVRRIGVRSGLFHSGDLVRQDEEGYSGRRPHEGHDHLRARTSTAPRSRTRPRRPPRHRRFGGDRVALTRMGEVPVCVAAVRADLTSMTSDQFLTERRVTVQHPKASGDRPTHCLASGFKVLKTELRARLRHEID